MIHYKGILQLSTFTAYLSLAACSTGETERAGQTEILKWQDGKQAAVSLTYDDGSINQFRVALPFMEQYDMKGTFFINTAMIPGSRFQGRFIGRPVKEIIDETATDPTTPENLFERASAIGHLGSSEFLEAHTRAGAAVDAGNVERACSIIDEAYEQVRQRRFDPKIKSEEPGRSSYAGDDRITWDEIREFADRGHEFASHTLTHPRLAVLDEVNMRWELEKCKEEILNQLGPEHTFSCECPYGTENERVMKVAHQIYPALRNRMPHPWLEELNRSSRRSPGSSDRAYVQWQRGPLSHTTLDVMNSWIDTCLQHDNIWLVLVFHGVEGIGWEPLDGDTIGSYFRAMAIHDSRLWVAPFREVTKYMRERMNGRVESDVQRSQIRIDLQHGLDRELYDLPLTLRTYVPERWGETEVSQNGEKVNHQHGNDGSGNYVQYSAMPNGGPVLIRKLR
jgi:peptidoglycan/xylan/chitin deacetylase (PgdA/CDA1 family)